MKLWQFRRENEYIAFLVRSDAIIGARICAEKSPRIVALAKQDVAEEIITADSVNLLSIASIFKELQKQLNYHVSMPVMLALDAILITEYAAYESKSEFNSCMQIIIPLDAHDEREKLNLYTAIRREYAMQYQIVAHILRWNIQMLTSNSIACLAWYKQALGAQYSQTRRALAMRAAQYNAATLVVHNASLLQNVTDNTRAQDIATLLGLSAMMYEDVL